MFGDDESGSRLKAAGARIREARKAAGLNQTELGNLLSLRQSVISDWEQGKLASWRDHLDALVRHLKISPTELDGSVVFTSRSSPTRGIEVVGEVQGGAFRMAVEWPPEERNTVPMPSVPGYERVQLRALKVVGPSVNEIYPDGTYVIVASAADTDVRSGDRVVVYRRQGDLTEATIKEVRVDDDGHVVLWPRSTHPDHQDPIYLEASDQDAPEIAYVVVGSFRMENRPPPPIRRLKR